MKEKEEPTIQTHKGGTLDNFKESDTDTGKSGRKYLINRFIIHIKETWPTYLTSIIGMAAFFFFVTFNVKIAEINKDISYLYIRLDDNTRKIEKIADELSSFRENVSKDIASFQSDLKSLDSKFDLFIELFRQGDNNMLPDRNN
jgi:site-specific DNA-adenine methylase